jgi:hypothetical protein
MYRPPGAGAWPATWPRLEDLEPGKAVQCLEPRSFPSSDAASSLPHMQSKQAWKEAMTTPQKQFCDVVGDVYLACALCPNAHSFPHITAEKHFKKVWEKLEFFTDISYEEAHVQPEFWQTHLFKDFGIRFNHLDGAIEVFSGRIEPRLALRAPPSASRHAASSQPPPPPGPPPTTLQLQYTASSDTLPAPPLSSTPLGVPAPDQQFERPPPLAEPSRWQDDNPWQPPPSCGQPSVSAGPALRDPPGFAGFAYADIHRNTADFREPRSPSSSSHAAGKHERPAEKTSWEISAAGDELSRLWKYLSAAVREGDTCVVDVRRLRAAEAIVHAAASTTASTPSLPESCKPTRSQRPFVIGDIVDADFFGQWYSAKVRAVLDDGQVQVEWEEDGSVTNFADLRSIRHREYQNVATLQNPSNLLQPGPPPRPSTDSSSSTCGELPPPPPQTPPPWPSTPNGQCGNLPVQRKPPPPVRGGDVGYAGRVQAQAPTDRHSHATASDHTPPRPLAVNRAGMAQAVERLTQRCRAAETIDAANEVEGGSRSVELEAADWAPPPLPGSQPSPLPTTTATVISFEA